MPAAILGLALAGLALGHGGLALGHGGRTVGLLWYRTVTYHKYIALLRIIKNALLHHHKCYRHSRC